MTIILLRVASVLMAVFAAGHIFGGFQKWSPMGDNAVLRAMTSERFDVMGISRSYLEFYTGFGWSIAVGLILQAVLLWQMAGLFRLQPDKVRPMIAVFAVATLASGIVAWRLIFLVPAALSSVLFLLLLAAFLTSFSGRIT